MGALPACVPVHRTAMPIGANRGHLPLMTWSDSWCKLLCRCWEPSLFPLPWDISKPYTCVVFVFVF